MVYAFNERFILSKCLNHKSSTETKGGLNFIKEQKSLINFLLQGNH